ncbi:hypothetical protein ACN28I_47025 [Archangium gephyra]|uniref:hypothetical protein n=1 Tax=Archangium gephyra TaxID=48 RepID=UPI003B7DAC07
MTSAAMAEAPLAVRPRGVKGPLMAERRLRWGVPSRDSRESPMKSGEPSRMNSLLVTLFLSSSKPGSPIHTSEYMPMFFVQNSGPTLASAFRRKVMALPRV